MSSEIHQPSYIVNEGLQELQENKERLVGSFGTGLGSRATCTVMKKNRVCKAHFRCAACCVLRAAYCVLREGDKRFTVADAYFRINGMTRLRGLCGCAFCIFIATHPARAGRLSGEERKGGECLPSRSAAAAWWFGSTSTNAMPEAVISDDSATMTLLWSTASLSLSLLTPSPSSKLNLPPLPPHIHTPAFSAVMSISSLQNNST